MLVSGRMDVSTNSPDRQTLFLALINIAVLAAGGFLAGSNFMDSYNLQSMASQVPELGLLAFGVMLAMISGNGGIDLSGIALANLSGVVAFLLTRHYIPAADAPLLFSWVFAGLALVVGMIGGITNGIVIAYARLTPLIATLGTQLLFTGIAVFLTNGSAVSMGFIEPLDNFGNMPVLGIPLCFALFLAIALALSFLLKYTPFGVKLMLLGSNAGGGPLRRHQREAHASDYLYLVRTACFSRRDHHCSAQLIGEMGLRWVLRADRDPDCRSGRRQAGGWIRQGRLCADGCDGSADPVEPVQFHEYFEFLPRSRPGCSTAGASRIGTYALRLLVTTGRQ